MPHYAEIIGGRLWQGSYPEPFAIRKFDVVINVSDSVHGSIGNDADFINGRPDSDFDPDVKVAMIKRIEAARHFWFPVNETGKWDYAAFFGTKRILDHYLLPEDSQTTVLVHCSAGAYRSVLATYAWLYSHEEEGFMEDDKDLWDKFLASPRAPRELPQFLEAMNQHPTYCIGGILGVCKLYDQMMVK